jgi:hypothetical protein
VQHSREPGHARYFVDAGALADLQKQARKHSSIERIGQFIEDRP